MLASQVDLHVGYVRAAPIEIMPHQPIEVKRRGHAGVTLVIRDFGFNSHRCRNFPRRLRRAFQRTAFRHIQYDLEFTFVVEWQHLNFGPGQSHKSHRGQKQQRNAA